jgi:hypothetical protein
VEKRDYFQLTEKAYHARLKTNFEGAYLCKMDERVLANKIRGHPLEIRIDDMQFKFT